jgi:hypothetical protein
LAGQGTTVEVNPQARRGASAAVEEVGHTVVVVIGLQGAASTAVHHHTQRRAGTDVHAIVHAVLVVVVVFLRVRTAVAISVQGEAQPTHDAAWASIGRVDATVVVVVRVLFIGASVTVVVRFARVPNHAQRTTVVGVEHTVLVVVLVVTFVLATVPIVVVGGRGRPGVEIQRASVIGFEHAVVVGVLVAGVADTVAVKVSLTGVVHVGAHVRLVDPFIAIGVDVGTSVALLVLLGGGDPADRALWAGVVVIEHAVLIVVKVLVAVPAPVLIVV